MSVALYVVTVSFLLGACMTVKEEEEEPKPPSSSSRGLAGAITVVGGEGGREEEPRRWTGSYGLEGARARSLAGVLGPEAEEAVDHFEDVSEWRRASRLHFHEVHTSVGIPACSVRPLTSRLGGLTWMVTQGPAEGLVLTSPFKRARLSGKVHPGGAFSYVDPLAARRTCAVPPVSPELAERLRVLRRPSASRRKPVEHASLLGGSFRVGWGPGGAVTLLSLPSPSAPGSSSPRVAICRPPRPTTAGELARVKQGLAVHKAASAVEGDEESDASRLRPLLAPRDGSSSARRWRLPSVRTLADAPSAEGYLRLVRECIQPLKRLAGNDGRLEARASVNKRGEDVMRQLWALVDALWGQEANENARPLPLQGEEGR